MVNKLLIGTSHDFMTFHFRLLCCDFFKGQEVYLSSYLKAQAYKMLDAGRNS